MTARAADAPSAGEVASAVQARRSIGREVVALALPAIGLSLLHTLVFLVDRAMLAAHSREALASMQIGGPLVWSIFSVLTCFSVGTVALVGRAVGAVDRALARDAARGALAFALATGALTAVVSLAFHREVAGLLGRDGGAAVIAQAAAYLRAVLACAPTYFVATLAGATLAAGGNTRTPFVAGLLANAINVAGNYVLIFGHYGAPRLGAGGAGIASAAGFTVEAVVLVAALCRRDGPVSLLGGPWVARASWNALVRILRVSFASLLEKLAYHGGFLGFVYVIATLGALAMAANQALISIESIAFLTADGVGVAAAAVVAQRLGAAHPDEAAKGARASLLLGVALLGSFGLVFALVPSVLVRLLTDDPAIIAVAVPCMYVAAVAQPFMAIGTVLSQVLRGAGDTRTALLVSLSCALVVRLVATCFAVFVLDLGLVGVWVGSTVDWATRTVLLAIAYRRGRWRALKV
ncbi:MAG: MATE family efflux transporter [Deltaproteobacteria bacterium]|nr:MATE family efflux transporter [Deltaproteobacteria bacterium]